MGVTSFDAPQWFLSSFVRSVRGAGGTATEEDIRAIGQSLLDRWDQPERRFHNLGHLADVLGGVDQFAEETHDPDLVRLAAWYHGAVFSSQLTGASTMPCGEDEVAGACLALTELTGLGVPSARAQRVAELVNALIRHSPDPTDFDCAVLCDADLAMLAAEPQRYKAYLRAIRDEYGHLPEREFLDGRIAFLSRLLARECLFSSPRGATWEEPARQNLAAELARLRKERTTLDAAAMPTP